MNYAYIRFSTDKQDETQQIQAISEYATPKGITIDAYEKDEGISGGVSYKDRNLSLLVQRMKQGDCLIVSEISRLGRSMSDLNKLINDELKPRKVRLIVIKMGIDMDCAHLTAVDEMIFFSLSFSAQIEKEMIQQRTQSAIDARKAAIEKEGGFFSKSGRWTTSLGAKRGHDYGKKAGAAAGAKHTRQATEWRKSSALYLFVENQLLRRRPRREILSDAQRLFEEKPELYCTREGKPLCEGTLSRWAREIHQTM